MVNWALAVVCLLTTIAQQGDCLNFPEIIDGERTNRLLLPYRSHLGEGFHSNCRNNIPACLTCNQKCQSTAMTQFREEVMSASIALEACYQELTKFREEIPDWCLISAAGFSSRPGFVPKAAICDSIDLKRCVSKWNEELRREVRNGKLSNMSSEYRTGFLAGEFADLQRDVQKFSSGLTSLRLQMKKYKAERRRRLLEQAHKHLRKLDRSDTVYADPVFDDIYQLVKQNNMLDGYISRNDEMIARIESDLVRKETTDKVPGLLRDISGLQNHIHSRRDETDSVLAGIKGISEEIARLQENATQVVFELTYSRKVDGTISFLDKGLLDSYVKLKNERGRLRQANMKATSEKMGLVRAMRSLVQEISRRQAAEGCAASELSSQTHIFEISKTSS